MLLVGLHLPLLLIKFVKEGKTGCPGKKGLVKEMGELLLKFVSYV